MTPAQLSQLILRVCGLSIVADGVFQLIAPHGEVPEVSVTLAGLAGFAFLACLPALLLLPIARILLAALVSRTRGAGGDSGPGIACMGLAGAVTFVLTREAARVSCQTFFPVFPRFSSMPDFPLPWLVSEYWIRFLGGLLWCALLIWGSENSAFTWVSRSLGGRLAPACLEPEIPISDIARILWRAAAIWILIQPVLFIGPILEAVRDAQTYGGGEWSWGVFPLILQLAARFGIGLVLLFTERNWSHRLLGPAGGPSRSPNRMAWAGVGLIIIVLRLEGFSDFGITLLQGEGRGIAELFLTHFDREGEVLHLAELGLGLCLAFGFPIRSRKPRSGQAAESGSAPTRVKATQ